MSKKLLLFIVTVIVLVGVYFGFTKYKENSEISKIDVREFQGSLVKVDGNLVTINGSFVSSADLPKKLKEPQNFTFSVDQNSKITKLEIFLPTYEALASTGSTTGSFSIKDLPRTNGVGSLDDLNSSRNRGSVVVTAHFDTNINNKQTQTAGTVFYQVLVDPNKQR